MPLTTWSSLRINARLLFVERAKYLSISVWSSSGLVSFCARTRSVKAGLPALCQSKAANHTRQHIEYLS